MPHDVVKVIECYRLDIGNSREDQDEDTAR